MIKTILFILALSLTTLAAQAQTYTTNSFSFPQAHPRLWIPTGSARLTQAKAWAAANPITCLSNDYTCIAFEHVTTGSDCSSAITWAANTNQSNQQSQRGGSGGWPPLSSETQSGTAGANDMRWNAEDVYLIFDWCYDQWSSGQKSAFVTANQGWLTTVDQQCWGGVIGGPNSCTVNMYQSNFYLGYLRNDIEFGIATYGDNGTGGGSAADNDIVSGINRWETFVTAYANPGMQGGIPEEGTEYGTAFWYLILPFETIELGGRDIIGECDYLRQLATYWLIYDATPAATQSTLAGRTATYAQFDYSDNEVTQSHNAMWDISGINLYWQDVWNFGSNFWSSTGNTGGLIRLLYNTVTAHAATGTNYGFYGDPYYMAVDNAPSAAANFSALPLDYYAPGFPYAFTKTAWDTTSTEVMLQMTHILSNNVGDHIHSDDGSFTMWRGGYWVDRETTGYSQILSGSSAFQSNANQGTASQFAHNTLVFTNPELDQIDPGSLPGINPGGTPTVYRVQSKPGYFYADVDLTQNYLWDSGHAPSYQTGVVGHVEREFIYVRALETLVVFDRLLTQNQTNLGSLTAAQVVTTFLNHCETNPTVVDSQHFRCVDVAQDAEQTVLEPTSATSRVINEDTCTGCTGSPLGQFRIEVDTSGTAQRYNLDVIQAYPDSGGCPLTATNTDSNSGDPTSGTFTVTLTPMSGGGCSTPGSVTTIVLNKSLCGTTVPSQCSSGGTINVAGAGAVSLGTTVQAISFTNNGPVWAGTQATNSGITGVNVSGGVVIH